jgi:hypothetical protein
VERCGVARKRWRWCAGNKKRGHRGPSVRLPNKSIVVFYLFLDDFFPPFLAAFFLAAMLFTTFHAVRDLPVALTWQKAPECSGRLACVDGGEWEERPVLMTINGR